MPMEAKRENPKNPPAADSVVLSKQALSFRGDVATAALAVVSSFLTELREEARPVSSHSSVRK
jgi:hypothetical protein